MDSDSGHNLIQPLVMSTHLQGIMILGRPFILATRATERLCHLIRKTECEAEDIVFKSPLSNEGFDVAWRDFKMVYQNPRMLVNYYLAFLPLTRIIVPGLRP